MLSIMLHSNTSLLINGGIDAWSKGATQVTFVDLQKYFKAKRAAAKKLFKTYVQPLNSECCLLWIFAINASIILIFFYLVIMLNFML